MKTFLRSLQALLCLLLLAPTARAQTFDEWFRQKKTQERYLLEQISALRLYGGYVQDGYQVARRGLAAIGLDQEGERDLHAAFLQSLSGVAPAVARHAKGADAAALQESLRETGQRTVRLAQASGLLHGQEVAYVRRVFGRLEAEGAAQLETLREVETAGRLELGDAARLERGEAAYRTLVELQLLARRFADQVRALVLARRQAQWEAETLRHMYNLTPHTP